MSINFATIKGWEIPEGIVTQVECNGIILWKLANKAIVTIKSKWLGMDGDTASITVNSTEPFAPDPTNPSYKTNTWTVSVADEPNCTIEIPVGSTIECTVSRDKGNADSYIKLNDTKVVTGEGTYLYTVTGNVTVTIEDKYSQGDYGMITLTETNEVILEVKKITSSTYANGQYYSSEQFILLDIYPKTNGTVTVTYGGLTKTITDTSGVAEPNAQQVFFGTFNGVSDEVETPKSGRIKIKGDFYAFGCSMLQMNSYFKIPSMCITNVNEFGISTKIPNSAFERCYELTSINIPESVVSIGDAAFFMCEQLTSVTMRCTTPPTLGSTDGVTYDVFDSPNLKNIIVPSGYGAVYKSAKGWSTYADKIVEA